MESIEIKSIAELLDQLMIVNLKIWHLVDKGYAGDGNAAVKAQRLNETRGQLMRAINSRLEPNSPNLTEKIYES